MSETMQSSMVVGRSTRTLLFIGLLTAAANLLIYFFRDGKVSTFLICLVGFGSGALIGWVVKQFLMQGVERLPVWGLLGSSVVGGFIGMGLGQYLRFRLIDIPYLATIRNDIAEFSIALDVRSFFANLSDTYVWIYLGLVLLGTFIGTFGLRRILNVVVKWALDYKP